MNKTELKKALQWRIRLAQIVLIPAGMEIYRREFILFELSVALEMSKPVVGILPRGMKKVPRIITENARETVGWCGKSIVEAIERNAY